MIEYWSEWKDSKKTVFKSGQQQQQKNLCQLFVSCSLRGWEKEKWTSTLNDSAVGLMSEL